MRSLVFFGGMAGHCQNIFAAERSYTSLATTAQLGSAYDDDDEPVEPPPAADAAENGMLLLRTHLEYPAIANDAAHDGFAVMLHVKAPSLVDVGGRPPVDLVTVLDVSGSMAGAKLEQVKRAMGFVVDSLGPHDRLSVVTFSDDARRVIRLTRMSEEGKDAAKRAVESLVAAASSSGSGSANIRAGLDEAAKVRDGRRHNNDVATVILVSDGHGCTASDYSDLVPLSFVRNDRCKLTPVHTFVLGSDNHGAAAAAMHHISEVTGGTFSFVEDHAVIQDALARCVAGLLSLAAEGVWIEVDCSYPSVRLKALKSGRYECSIKDWDRDWYWEDQEFTVTIGDLYADEERRFLLLLDFEKADGPGVSGTTFMKLECSYWDTATRQEVQVVSEGHWIPRPIDAGDVAPSMDVKREILRVEAAEGMSLARVAAERGDHAETARILDARRESLMSRSPPALSGDATCKALVAQLHELSLRVSDEREYRRTGGACLLAGVSSHAQQRTSSVRLSRPVSFGFESGCAGSAMFATPTMRKMEKLSEMLRERQRQKEAALAEDGRMAVVPRRRRLEARLAAAAPRLSMLRRYRRLMLLKR